LLTDTLYSPELPSVNARHAGTLYARLITQVNRTRLPVLYRRSGVDFGLIAEQRLRAITGFLDFAPQPAES
jgi:hypothetical protein